MLFLSYAEEDSHVAWQIGRWLEEHVGDVFIWQDPRYQGGRFIQRIVEKINEADVFVALLSPDYLASTWCGREWEVAMQRELDLHDSGDDRAFIYVLKIIDGPYQKAGFLRSYNWADATTRSRRQQALAELLINLRPDDYEQAESKTAAQTKPDPPAVAQVAEHGSVLFRNRQDELRRVLDGLTSTAGQHFWLVLAPPQLGKTWFLDQLTLELMLAHSAHWVTNSVDLRTQPPSVLGDPGALLALLFGRPAPVTTDDETLVSIAKEISRSEKSHLCVLDSAELLDRQIARRLRSCLSQIYNLLRSTGHTEVRLAFLVASRQEDSWRGVHPSPRWRALPLTEFNVDIVNAALRDLAKEMRRGFSDQEYTENADLVHHLSEGLPALLLPCLQWIRSEEWLRMGRLKDQDTFAELAYPYIEKQLLSLESLVPWHETKAGRQETDPQQPLEQTLRVLAPYRLFTQSHLRHYLDSDNAFSESLASLNWSLEGLWHAIGATALLKRPQPDPWHEIHPAIRRLLYRYYYTTDEDRAVAHREACQFVKQWADRQSGKEQAIGLVECLWHEASALSLSEPSQLERALCASANALSLAIQPSQAYTAAELRRFAAEQMMNDDEFQAALSGVPGLFDRLVEIVMAPQET